jgi:hypothetical protein
VDVPAFDGWRVTVAGWHYALGKDITNYGTQDGWVGFGGRQGQHWFKFRLLRAGYLHWPTRVWDDIGGPPDYDRANLTNETRTMTIGPNDDAVNVESVATWSGLWSTPGGGSVDARWRINGDRLKEDVILNQAGREWIAANHPPATPLNETYFGFVFRLDWSDIPKVLRAGVLQSVDSDFADDDENIELRDALDRLLAFMPLSDVIVANDDPSVPTEKQPLRKRFYKDGTNHYLLVGVRCDILNGMSAGDLVFDPTVDYQVGASTDDGFEIATVMDITSNSLGAIDSSGDYIGCRWTGVTIPDGATIDVSYATLYFDYDNLDEAYHYIWFEDGAAPGTLTTGASDISNRTATTATVLWDEGVLGFDQWNNTYSLNAILTELMASYSYSSGSSMVFILQGADSAYDIAIRSYDWNTAYAGKLHIEYTAAAAGPLPMAMDLYRRRRSG